MVMEYLEITVYSRWVFPVYAGCQMAVLIDCFSDLIFFV